MCACCPQMYMQRSIMCYRVVIAEDAVCSSSDEGHDAR